MTQEEKQLLLKDLCSRLPYGVKFVSFSESMKHHSEPVTLRQIYYHNECDANNIEGDNDISTIIDLVKLYLRPMSSMTEEERKEVEDLNMNPFSGSVTDWLNSYHFDYRNLIDKGLALEAPKDMYNFNNKEK